MLGKYDIKAKDCMKSVLIWSFSGRYFLAFGLNMKRYSVSLRIQSKWRNIRISKTPNTEIFHAVKNSAVPHFSVFLIEKKFLRGLPAKFRSYSVLGKSPDRKARYLNLLWLNFGGFCLYYEIHSHENSFKVFPRLFLNFSSSKKYTPIIYANSNRYPLNLASTHNNPLWCIKENLHYFGDLTSASVL